MKNLIPNNGKNKPVQVDYPREWLFKVIGLDLELLKTAIEELFPDQRHRLNVSQRSSRGKYVSMDFLLTVASFEECDRIYQSLRNHPHVTIVM